MKILDYLAFALLIAGMAIGVWIGNFAGGGVWGICLCSFIYAVIGFFVKKKATARMEANINRLKNDIANLKTEDDADSENN